MKIYYHFLIYFEIIKTCRNLEQKALKLAKGSILDVGCGAGSHSLYLQEKGLKVKAIDISKGAIDVAKQRGIIHAIEKNVLDETECF